MWPASALLTGNGVAFILRVPGTEHGDWWSMNGWWIFAGTAAVSLLSKYVIKFRGSHVFNPSNFGLVLCFLLLGPEHADPLDFWWGPMSPALAFALVIITVGGLSILSRLKLLEIAVGFWLAFAGGLGVLAASGHEMTARWHLGPITGWEFWRVLVFSPEILVFLFFMITDPRTIPRTGAGRRAYAIGIGLLAVLLIAPQTTEFATKVAVLGALFHRLRDPAGARLPPGAAALRAAVAPRRRRHYARRRCRPPSSALVVLAGIPARPDEASASAAPARATPRRHRPAVEGRRDAARPRAAREQIARDVVANLGNEADAVLLRDPDRATARRRRGAARLGLGAASTPAGADGRRPGVRPRAHDGDARARRGAGAAARPRRRRGNGRARHLPRDAADRAGAGNDPRPFRQTLELVLSDGRYLIVGSRGPTPPGPRRPRGRARAGAGDRAPARGRRGGVRVALPPRRVPLQDVERPGRRRWAAGSAGSTTTTTAGSTSTSSTRTRSRATSTQWRRRGGTPRSAPLPQRARHVRRRQPRLGRERLAAGERLRRRRPERRRAHRPLRHRGPATTRCSGTAATGRSSRAPARPGSRPSAGTAAPRPAT